MPADNVVSLTSAEIQSYRKQAFLDAVAGSYDIYVKNNNFYPDGIVYVMGGVRQPSQGSWQVNGESTGCANAMISLAHLHLINELSGKTV